MQEQRIGSGELRRYMRPQFWQDWSRSRQRSLLSGSGSGFWFGSEPLLGDWFIY